MAVTYRAGVDIGGTFTDIVLLGSDGTVHTKKISSSIGNYAQAIVDGLSEVFSETGLSGAAIDEIRHGTTVASNAILEHKGARVGLITTKGFRDVLEIRTLAHAQALRHRLDQARTAGRALPAQGRRRAHRPSRQGRARARSGRRRARRRRAAGREGRGDRRLPAELLRQSGARGDAEGDHCRQGPSPAQKPLVRGAAGDQGVRAHLDDGDQRLCHADRRHLPAGAAQGARRRRHPGPPAADAVERRPDHRWGRGRAADEHHRIRSGRRRGRRPGAGPRQGPRQDHHLRHGRHDRQGLDGRARRGRARPGIRRRRRHHDRLAAADRRRLHAEGAGDRPRRGRRRRRLACLDRRRRRPAGRPGERRRLARPGLLRPGRRPNPPSPTPTCCWATSTRRISSAAR